jgi:serine/threonine protein kinase
MRALERWKETFMAKKKPGDRYGDWTLTGEKPIGEGGNSIVWQVKHDDGTTTGAIKVLKSGHIAERDKKKEKEQRVQRFLNEIKFHTHHRGRPGILPLLDAHVPKQLTPDSPPWLVTSLAVPLSAVVLRDTFTTREAIQRVAEAAATLSTLHGEEKYHRDLKPENLFEFEGQTRIGDFGLVQAPELSAVTESGDFSWASILHCTGTYDG